MQQDNDRISTWQMMVILVSTINATGVLRLPRLLAERVGPDGWASLTVGHGAGFLIILVMIRLSRLYPGVTFVEYSRRICGPFGSWLIVITASSFWLLVMARIVREFAEVMKVFVLLRTPIEVIIISMLLVSIYLVRHGLEPIARVLEVLFPIFIGIIVINLILALPEIDWGNFQPVFGSGASAIVTTGLREVLDLEGLEVFLLLPPFMLKPRRALMAATIGLGINLIVRIAIFVTTFGVLGMHTNDSIWPLAIVVKYLEVPGGIFERLDILFLILWVTVAFGSLVVYYYLASLALSRLLGFRQQSCLVFPLLPIIYFIALLPPTVITLLDWSDIFEYVGLLVIVLFPCVLLVVNWLRSLLGREG